MEKLLEKIQKDVDQLKEDFEDLDDKSFNYNEGILISGNEAQSLIDYIKALEEYNQFLVDIALDAGLYKDLLPSAQKQQQKLRETISSIKAKTF